MWQITRGRSKEVRVPGKSEQGQVRGGQGRDQDQDQVVKQETAGTCRITKNHLAECDYETGA